MFVFVVFCVCLTPGLSYKYIHPSFHGMHRPTHSHPASNVWMLTRTFRLLVNPLPQRRPSRSGVPAMVPPARPLPEEENIYQLFSVAPSPAWLDSHLSLDSHSLVPRGRAPTPNFHYVWDEMTMWFWTSYYRWTTPFAAPIAWPLLGRGLLAHAAHPCLFSH